MRWRTILQNGINFNKKAGSTAESQPFPTTAAQAGQSPQRREGVPKAVFCRRQPGALGTRLLWVNELLVSGIGPAPGRTRVQTHQPAINPGSGLKGGDECAAGPALAFVVRSFLVRKSSCGIEEFLVCSCWCLMQTEFLAGAFQTQAWWQSSHWAVLEGPSPRGKAEGLSSRA